MLLHNYTIYKVLHVKLCYFDTLYILSPNQSHTTLHNLKGVLQLPLLPTTTKYLKLNTIK